jgi:YesN/AraC family two-component response regulator
MIASQQDRQEQRPTSALRVLLADDESHVRTYMKYVIGTLNLKLVGEAVNGRDAVNLFREKQPDLLIMDLNMPVLNGEEAMAEILAEYPSARIIILSSSADRGNVETCAELGAANYLRKDCSFDEICEIVRETLDLPPAQAEPPP